jgi:hypothetical protein
MTTTYCISDESASSTASDTSAPNIVAPAANAVRRKLLPNSFCRRREPTRRAIVSIDEKTQITHDVCRDNFVLLVRPARMLLRQARLQRNDNVRYIAITFSE